MNVAEFITWLKTQDQGAEVMCIMHTDRGCGYYEQGGTAYEDEFTAEKSEYKDFSKYDWWHERHAGTGDNPKTLCIGELRS